MFESALLLVVNAVILKMLLHQSFLGLEEMDWAGNIFFKPGTGNDSNVNEWDFTDVLFSSFNTSPQLFPFPNPREIGELQLKRSLT